MKPSEKIAVWSLILSMAYTITMFVITIRPLVARTGDKIALFIVFFIVYYLELDAALEMIFIKRKAPPPKVEPEPKAPKIRDADFYLEYLNKIGYFDD